MKNKQFNIDDNHLIISARKSPIFIRIVLTTFLVLIALIPIAVTIFVLKSGEGPFIGIVFSFLLCWGIGFYLLKLTLWNSVGREILSMETEKISYVADYRLFKDRHKEIEIQDLETELIREEQFDKPLGRLRLKTKSNSLETVLQMKISEVEELRKEIQTRYNIA
ncbi:hypothetical protein [Aequorivita sp. KMM 9714]|uniref:hypothetical protein n=1 Tax=Aequorivita sp. KMM 9714 TaxID=2707173 RepID=UPI0013EA481C|nr:hypothetical protein [Aequorivita sp. KMM 9714]NGX84311.1 hypothetical protein [Aequorivita sp. KMM 9714]